MPRIKKQEKRKAVPLIRTVARMAKMVEKNKRKRKRKGTQGLRWEVDAGPNHRKKKKRDKGSISEGIERVEGRVQA